MKILFIHQNFPGQFKHVAPALVRSGHEVRAMTIQNNKNTQFQGVKLERYAVGRGSTQDIHPWLSDFETKVIRGEACFKAAVQLRSSGYVPDVVIAHHGWGESLFIKDVWPSTKLGIYCEFFYHHKGADVGFDPEFPSKDPFDVCRLHMKNINNIVHFEFADAGISPTLWQASTFPMPFRSKIEVIHDGIDTDVIRPNSSATLTLNRKIQLTRSDEIITFVNRNLEPYRGYHIFMRALPELLRSRPAARVLIVGGNDVSYGARPDGQKNWKDIFIEEVREAISDDDWKRVHFLGNIGYQPFIALLQLSTVHVYLTYPFVLSWSLLEAMSAGCSIVASDTQPLQEVIKNDQSGRLVNFFDSKALCEAVCDLLDHPNERQRLGTNARKIVQTQYDLRTVCIPRQLHWIEGLGTENTNLQETKPNKGVRSKK